MGAQNILVGLQMDRTSLYPTCKGWKNDASAPIVSGDETHPHLGLESIVKCVV